MRQNSIFLLGGAFFLISLWFLFPKTAQPECVCPPAPVCTPSHYFTEPDVHSPEPEDVTETVEITESKLRDCTPEPYQSSDLHSQDGQDRFVFEQLFKNKCGGTFIEMGAFDGTILSNSWFLEHKMGWHGLCIEASPSFYQRLTKNRPNCINRNVVIGPTKKTVKFLEIINGPEMLSGIYDDYDPRHLDRIQREIERDGGKSMLVDVPMLPLETVLKEEKLPHIDIFFLDVEGGEMSVLRALDWDTLDVSVFFVEDNYHTGEMTKFLEEKGYENVGHVGADWVMKKRGLEL
eukprot:TRINITY_DN2422_c0_g1_i1.p1 TRINITY_DN2422_c0_g1~~TRINITY_DN2422_c0_g1_i1.p1  ORF type:complete len:291 (-),score=46.97 TRINITY_DN2422_c0_g1_i1:169-1041(-)